MRPKPNCRLLAEACLDPDEARVVAELYAARDEFIPCFRDRVKGGGFLIQALENRRFKLANLYVELGADVNARSSSDRTPLMIAASAGNQRMYQVLLENGADADARDIDGRTAKSWAELRGHELPKRGTIAEQIRKARERAIGLGRPPEMN